MSRDWITPSLSTLRESCDSYTTDFLSTSTSYGQAANRHGKLPECCADFLSRWKAHSFTDGGGEMGMVKISRPHVDPTHPGLHAEAILG